MLLDRILANFCPLNPIGGIGREPIGFDNRALGQSAAEAKAAAEKNEVKKSAGANKTFSKCRRSHYLPDAPIARSSRELALKAPQRRPKQRHEDKVEVEQQFLRWIDFFVSFYFLVSLLLLEESWRPTSSTGATSKLGKNSIRKSVH